MYSKHVSVSDTRHIFNLKCRLGATQAFTICLKIFFADRQSLMISKPFRFYAFIIAFFVLSGPYHQFQAFIIASTATEEEMLKWYANFNLYSFKLSYIF